MLDLDAVLVDEKVVAECLDGAVEVELATPIVLRSRLRQNFANDDWIGDSGRFTGNEYRWPTHDHHIRIRVKPRGHSRAKVAHMTLTAAADQGEEGEEEIVHDHAVLDRATCHRDDLAVQV